VQIASEEFIIPSALSPIYRVHYVLLTHADGLLHTTGTWFLYKLKRISCDSPL